MSCRTFPLCLLVALLPACTAPLFLPEADPRPGPRAEIQLEVPFFPQASGHCGPGALASVLNYWQEKSRPEEISETVYLPELKGALPFDLAHYARSRGFYATSFKGSLEDLRDRLLRGHPLVAFLNLGTSLFPVGHFLVVTGLDPATQRVIVHSGMRQNKAVSYERFLAAWKGGGYWTLDIRPSEPG